MLRIRGSYLNLFTEKTKSWPILKFMINKETSILLLKSRLELGQCAKNVRELLTICDGSICQVPVPV